MLLVVFWRGLSGFTRFCAGCCGVFWVGFRVCCGVFVFMWNDAGVRRLANFGLIWSCWFLVWVFLVYGLVDCAYGLLFWFACFGVGWRLEPALCGGLCVCGGSDLVWLLVCLMRVVCGFKVRYLLIVLI